MTDWMGQGIPAALIRTQRSDQGTEGILVIGESFTAFTMELPWRDNRPNLSCIPPGRYRARVYESSHFGRVYHGLDVPGRTGILIHPGNFAGDREAGLRTDSYGCVLPGMRRGFLADQRAVLLSRPTVRRRLCGSSSASARGD